jgi:two-component system sensor histidine kinase KdpD
VTEHGVGLPPGQCGGLSDPFVRQGEGGRAGRGLAIAKAFVEAHRQRIWAETVSPAGARFVFTIPVALGGDAYERTMDASRTGECMTTRVGQD